MKPISITDENILTMEYYSATKNETLPFANIQMDSGYTMLSEIKSNRERQILYDIAYMWNLKHMMD